MTEPSNLPRVTVLMAVYNGARHVAEALRSILGQTFEDFEFLVVNDGSTDETREIVQAHPDPRIRLIDNPCNLGLTRSLNRGLAAARGELIARQDADDISEPRRLARQVAFLDAHPDVALLGTWYRKIAADGRLRHGRRPPCGWTELRWALLFYCPLVHSSVMFRRRAVLQRVGSYDETFEYAQDYDLWQRVAAQLRAVNLAQPLVRLRIHPDSMTATYARASEEHERVIRAEIGRVLGWTEAEADRAMPLVRKMGSFLFGSLAEVGEDEVDRLAEELFRLHAAFCHAHRIGRAASLRHRLRLRSRVAARLVEMAIRSGRHDPAVVRHLLARAARVHPPQLLGRKALYLYSRLLRARLTEPRASQGES